MTIAEAKKPPRGPMTPKPSGRPPGPVTPDKNPPAPPDHRPPPET
ncbi:hypothetical protein OHS33_35980 [Streptomyces sp. NBC_00536]|nr:hypothetical protein [Streptomyces sp. NBC_00536]WUC83306.1 hypothetical protein OHS33_35980 [Streptomyces sp. NBC_00536]